MPRQRGYLLVAMLLVLTSLSAIYLAAALNKQGLRADWRAQRETLRAMHDAKLALIAHGLIEDNTPGTLPSPSGAYGSTHELDGRSVPTGFTGTPGLTARRLPWHFLGLQHRADGNGDCLWYAVGSNYRNSNLNTEARDPADGTAINPTTPGALLVNDATGVATSGATAVLISAGPALATQTRSSPTSATCGSGTIDQFLEASNAEDAGSYLNGGASESFNDTVIGITHSQQLRPVLRRVLTALSSEDVRAEIAARMAAQPTGITAGTLAQLRGIDVAAYMAFDAMLVTPAEVLTYTPSHRTCPGVDTAHPYLQPVSWLCFNDWYSHITFQRDAKTLFVSLEPTPAYHCTLALESGQVSCTN